MSLGEAFRVWVRVAALSFGGPAGQIAVMHRIVVEEKRWIGERRFLHALNYCMLLPGPEAQQLATYIGWLMHRTTGGVMAGVLFVLPGVVSVMALSLVYALYGKVGIVSGLFFGLKTAVLAVVLQAVLRVGGRALRNRTMAAIAAAAFAAIFFAAVPFPAIILGAGLVGYAAGYADRPAFRAGGPPAAGQDSASVEDGDARLGEELPDHARPTAASGLRISGLCLILWLAPVLALRVTLGPSHVMSQIATFFSGTALVTFGGAYAVLAYGAQEAVQAYGWLSPGEMLDGLGMAETTPGPLVMVLQFVGFMAAYRTPGALAPVWAGIAGGLLATWVTFVPCFLFIFLGAPFIEALRGHRALHGALSAVTAAVVGVILNLAIWFALHTVFRETRPVRGYGFAFDLPVPASLDPWALVLSAIATAAVLRFGAGTLPTIAASAGAGMLLHLSGLAG